LYQRWGGVLRKRGESMRGRVIRGIVADLEAAGETYSGLTSKELERIERSYHIPPTTPKDRTRLVYFVHVAEARAIKIGKSTGCALAGRLMSLQIANPFPMQLLAVVPESEVGSESGCINGSGIFTLGASGFRLSRS
jgi:hypothetical protein